MQIIRQKQQNRCSRQPSATWEMAWQLLSLPANSIFKSFTSSVLSDMAKILAQATMMKSIKGIGSVLGFDLSSLSLNANGGIYQSADLSRYSGTVVNRDVFCFCKRRGCDGGSGT